MPCAAVPAAWQRRTTHPPPRCLRTTNAVSAEATFMDSAVCMTRLATTRCTVIATDVSTRATARNQAQTRLLGLHLRSAPARAGGQRGRRSGRVHWAA
ncbi:unnamed protein product [Ectocarpus sp. CCAP 1310/34]|nr:unnamed protein product [Ectocarpus sp. CCAP 1310/34]